MSTLPYGLDKYEMQARRVGTNGIELARDKAAGTPFDWTLRTGATVCDRARRGGVIVRPLGDVIVLMPPFCITDEQLTKLTDVVYRCVCNVTEELS